MAAIFGNGQALMSLQSWVALPVARRQPVSPKTRMRCGLGRGSGSALPSSTAATASPGTIAAQPRTGNCAGLTSPKLRPGAERTLMGIGLPSNVTDGQASSVMARTLEVPSGPTCTHWARILASAFCSGARPARAATAGKRKARQTVISAFLRLGSFQEILIGQFRPRIGRFAFGHPPAHEHFRDTDSTRLDVGDL